MNKIIQQKNIGPAALWAMLIVDPQRYDLFPHVVPRFFSHVTVDVCGFVAERKENDIIARKPSKAAVVVHCGLVVQWEPTDCLPCR